MPGPIDIDAVRAQFPALSLTDDGRPRVYMDNPAGTQVPSCVADAVRDCLLQSNANLGGEFASSRAADAIVASARAAMADFLNAASDDEIVFGQNMTTITLHLSRSIGRLLQRGDQIVLSCMDHDANVWPWVLMARDLGLEIVWVPFNTATYEFDADAFDNALSDKTRLVCVTGASNLTGTINDIAGICQKARSVGAMTYIDAVQSAPHVPTDVQALGCDFLVCSAYKFFGPHQGILWGRRERLTELEPYKVRPAPNELPWCFETGTQSHEGIAGVAATVDYFANIGAALPASCLARWERFSGRRRTVHAALDALFDYESALAEHLIAGLLRMDGVTIRGITASDAMQRRVPTVSFTHDRIDAASIAAALASRSIFVWSGHNYAVEVAKALDIYDTGGAVRIGPVHYNTIDEVDRVLAALAEVMN